MIQILAESKVKPGTLGLESRDLANLASHATVYISIEQCASTVCMKLIRQCETSTISFAL